MEAYPDINLEDKVIFYQRDIDMNGRDNDQKEVNRDVAEMDQANNKLRKEMRWMSRVEEGCERHRLGLMIT